jgi:hypothetical protein
VPTSMVAKIEPKAIVFGVGISVVGPYPLALFVGFCAGFIGALISSIPGTPSLADIHHVLSTTVIATYFLVITGFVGLTAGVVAGRLSSKNPGVQGLVVGAVTVILNLALVGALMRGSEGPTGIPWWLLPIFPVVWFGAPVLGARIVALRRQRRAARDNAA